jgi:hypothetical protein
MITQVINQKNIAQRIFVLYFIYLTENIAAFCFRQNIVILVVIKFKQFCLLKSKCLLNVAVLFSGFDKTITNRSGFDSNDNIKSCNFKAIKIGKYCLSNYPSNSLSILLNKPNKVVFHLVLEK